MNNTNEITFKRSTPRHLNLIPDGACVRMDRGLVTRIHGKGHTNYACKTETVGLGELRCSPNSFKVTARCNGVIARVREFRDIKFTG